jgi:uncharacterized membrane protein YccC
VEEPAVSSFHRTSWFSGFHHPPIFRAYNLLMASANPPLPLPHSPASASPPSLWTRQSSPLKQGIKTGLAGTITYAIYAGWHLPQGYWAVFAALVVTQANLGASWKAALYRTLGSTCGALAAALLIPILGNGPIGVLIVLFLLATLFGYLTALHPAFTAAGFTAALILVFGGQGEPWHMAWLRVLYTMLGAVVAFAVGALIWPVHARVGLRHKLASILDGAGALYRAVTAAALQGIDNEPQVRELDRQLHDLRRGITLQMDEARSELSFSRFNQGEYQAFVDQADQVRRRLTAMAEDTSLYVQAQLQPGLVPSLPTLVEKTTHTFAALAHAVRKPGEVLHSAELNASIRDLDADLAKLREQRATAPLALDRMLPFWALVFNLKEVAQDLNQLASTLPQVG